MKKWLISVLAVALLCASAGMLVAVGGRADATPVTVLAAAQEGETVQYRLGQSYTVPQKSFSTGAGEVTASSILIAPNGKATVETTVTLNQAGKWTVRYSAKAGGKVYSSEESFIVVNNAYTMHDSISSASYGRYTQYGSDSNGLQVKLAMNDTLTFEKVIDLTNLGKADTLIRGFVTPTTQGIADFGRIIFTLTDANDPSISMQITGSRYKLSTERGMIYTYFAANGQNQYNTGIETESNVHVADGLGTPVQHSFVAQKNSDGWAGLPAVNIVPDQYAFNITFDQAELTLYVNNAKVLDFDDAKYVEELWFGFPSKKVRLTVSASLYNSATANFCLTDVYGIDLTDEIFVDEDAPKIEVQVSDAYRVGDTYQMPEGRVGGTYPVYGATATDEISGKCAVTVKAYYNHLSDKPIAVPIVNGKFATENYGDYGIVYTAYDAMGNEAKEILNVHVGGTIPALTVTAPTLSSVEVGYFAEIPAPTTAGGSGERTWTATATLGGTTLDATNGFTPEKAGTWTVEYTARDYIGTEEKTTCSLTVTAGVAPVLPEAITLPSIMIAGASYTLPAVYAKDYTSGSLVETLCTVEIASESGIVQAVKKAGESFKPTVQNSGDIITLTYKCGTAKSRPYEVAVIDPWGANNAIDIGSYFYGAGFTAEVLNDNGVTIASKGTQDFSWTFANAQLSENASVVLKNIAGKTNCQALEITLTDAQDSSKSVTMRVTSLGPSSATVKVGERTISVTKSFASSKAETFTIRYAAKRMYLDTTAIDVTTDDAGAPFTGFSDKVFISVKAIGVTQTTQYLVGSLSGFTFTTFNYDDTAPKVSVLGDYGGTYAVGDTYEISQAIAGDVYCPNVTLTLTVRDPQNQVVTDVNGLTLSGVDASVSYRILLQTHGQYRISYTATEVDWKGIWGEPNTATWMFTVNVVDSQAPVVTFKHAFAATASVGDTLVIPDFTVTDDVTAAENIVVTKFVLNPDGKLIMLTGNSIKCEYAGDYEFRIIARDEAGNSSMHKFTVHVQ